MKTSLAVVLLCCVAIPAGARDLMTVTKDFQVGDARNVRIEFPVGSLTIRSGTGDRIAARMTARCHGDGDECAEKADRVRLVSKPEGSTLVLEVVGVPKLNNRGFSIGLELEIPKSLQVSIDMGAGELDVDGLEDDLDIHLGAGEADLRLPDHAVRKVRMDVGVGELNLRRGRDTWDGSGFISKRLSWSEGAGQSRVTVDLGVGEVDLILD